LDWRSGPQVLEERCLFPSRLSSSLSLTILGLFSKDMAPTDSFSPRHNCKVSMAVLLLLFILHKSWCGAKNSYHHTPTSLSA
jgi:hypothetical protein